MIEMIWQRSALGEEKQSLKISSTEPVIEKPSPEKEKKEKKEEPAAVKKEMKIEFGGSPISEE